MKILKNRIIVMGILLIIAALVIVAYHDYQIKKRIIAIEDYIQWPYSVAGINPSSHWLLEENKEPVTSKLIYFSSQKAKKRFLRRNKRPEIIPLDSGWYCFLSSPSPLVLINLEGRPLMPPMMVVLDFVKGKGWKPRSAYRLPQIQKGKYYEVYNIDVAGAEYLHFFPSGADMSYELEGREDAKERVRLRKKLWLFYKNIYYY